MPWLLATFRSGNNRRGVIVMVDLCADVWFRCRLRTPTVCGGLSSNGEVSGEVDQVRALGEEVIVQVRLQ
jgi:hypothetical protein